MPLLALVTDKNDHGNGALTVPPQNKWTVSGLLVTTVDTLADPDDVGHTEDEVKAATGSPKWTVAGKRIHRQDDLRYCGSKTVVTSQSKFTIG